MSPAPITDGVHLAPPPRRSRLLAAAFAVAAVAGACAALASSGLEDRTEPATQEAWPAGPIELGDPAVVKGARGGKTNPVTLPVFGDPTVRKGARGR